MKTILAILALSACSSDMESPPDAAPDAALDAAVADAPPPTPQPGCTMTYPFTRMITLNPGDPFPAALGNALQDGGVALHHGSLVRVIMGTEFCVSEGAPTRTGGSLAAQEWNIPTAAGSPGALVVDLGLPVGTRVTSMKVSYNRNSTGSAELLMAPYQVSLGDGGATGIPVPGTAGAGSSDTSTTGWGLREILSAPFIISDTYSYFFRIRGPNSGGSFTAGPKVDGIRITYDRS